ncbi:nuclear transport factor 2 family protein [Streptomyces sp. NBC_00503]|uniref:nuclear transport factor 2 family protein n=1 Tax=Streptomyces sp. NBC_00503 TaxID=2903659 RepID=UPI002E815B18|nr:nuclear transport factor 2 family protein [Streptomyces sp. NBC_00503]WUD85361.1 nuclear transport factor 2 family protein [Streptomyces sp. NBC_00503]
MNRTGIACALGDLLFNHDITLEEAAERHFAPGYRQRTDGEWADRAQFLDHISHLRGIVASGEVEVHEELHDGNKYADRHTCHITKNDGTTVTMEVYVFADLAPDGRFQRIEETTLMLSGSEADRTMGSAR